jgi:hypothetical protein
MAIAATLTITLSLVGQGQNSQINIPGAVMQNLNSPAEAVLVNLSSGFNALTPPSSPSPVPAFAIIVPPTNSNNSKTLKGVTGDTGIQVFTASPVLIPWIPGTTAMGITSGGSESVTVYWI